MQENLRPQKESTLYTTHKFPVADWTSNWAMGAVNSSQPIVSITLGPEFYIVHVHVQVKSWEKFVLFGTKIILLSVIERWHWEEVQLLSLTTVTTTVTIKCTCKHTDELPIRQYWLHWLYIVHVTAFLACLRLLDSLPRGTPNLWVHPMATSQPNSPGDLRTVRARRSVAHTAKAFRTTKIIAITTTFNNW